ncbi:hypothetical protein L1276_002579 [Flavobacterium sp. HSC-32F16]|uniref:hypothetical protein n=1 Tax=Flavobacterium sp. HSC-32F16 TaxID=2910964 RepID=UPI0020A5B9C0|nr:hypothetical protein [Flavobacterium sp. HSC-32F16]MCP2027422.1 hypothetical protein [Flavobacterium sp. HSC-32F16]
MDKIEFQNFKTGALLRTYYFDYFSKLENEIRTKFEKSLNGLNVNFKNKLFFYFGANHMFKFGLEYTDDKTTGTHKRFKEDESFKDFPIAKIIKIDKKDKMISEFKLSIHSINKKTVSYEFHDVVIKLINMRNILAHEPINFNFTEKEHVIESLSIEKINESNPFDIDGYIFSHENEQNNQIISNLLYMLNVVEVLKSI